MLETKRTLDIEKLRQDFPILKRAVNGRRLVYLDNAATTQKPQSVISAVKEYYENYNSNVHRGIYKLSEEATQKYEEAHAKAAKFINAGFKEIIFTKSATESINLLAYSLGESIKPGDEIVVSRMEHHSNLVPWQQLALRKGAKLKFIGLTADGRLNEENLNKAITPKTEIVAVAHMSNVLGTINNVKEIAKIAHENDAWFIIDGAQSIPHFKADVKALDCDFLAFSGHKMLAPTGIGVLYGKEHILEEMPPFLYGGDMIREVTFEKAKWNELPWKFEAGTPNIAQGIGFGAAIDYLNEIGMENIAEYEKELTEYAMEKLLQIEGIQIYGPRERGSLISFNLEGIHSHDVCTLLDGEGIALRGGHHCAMPLMSLLGVTGTARASFYFYNTKEEVDLLANALKRVKQVFVR